MDLMEITRASERVYSGVIVNVRVDRAELISGEVVRREVVEHPGGVAVLPLHDDGTVTVVRQFRYPFAEALTEIPAGKLEPGEDPREAALRELSEETGCVPGELISLGVIYPSPGYCAERLHLYLAKSLTIGAAHLDHNEFLTTERVPLDTLADRVLAGEIADAKTISAVLMTKMLISRGE